MENDQQCEKHDDDVLLSIDDHEVLLVLVMIYDSGGDVCVCVGNDAIGIVWCWCVRWYC